MNRNFGSVPGQQEEVKVLAGMATRLVTALLVLILSFGARPAAAESSPSTKVLLDALRKATLARPLSSITSIHTTGSIELVGIRGTAQEWDDLRDARFTGSLEAGALSGSFGWDGKLAWNQDYAGLVTVDGGMGGRSQTIDQAYLDNLCYLRPDAGGATVIYAGRRSDGGKNYDVLALTPPRGSEVQLWIDSRTHLIARETATFGIVSATTVLSNYHRIEGVTYPFDTVSRTSSGNSIVTQLSSLELNVDLANRIRVPKSSLHDFSIAGETTSVPIQVVNNHIYLTATLNGHGPFTFVLDSGGDYIVTPEVAAALQAKSSGGLQLQGVGSATEGAAFAHIDSIAIGNAIVRNQYTLVLPIATGFGVAEGLHIDGMVGHQFLARFLTTIDYANSKLTLAMPSTAPASAPSATAIPFFIDGSIPRISVGVDGVTTSAEVDTGSRAGLTLSSPFVAAHPSLAALAKTAPAVEGFGVGGASYARLGRVPTLQIGPYTIANSVAAFGVQTKGALADPFNPANLGGAIWRRFDLTFDYAHDQLLLAKSPEFDTPFSYDRSGLFLIDVNGAFTVISVLASTPAAAAGLAKGDVILTINGTPAASTSLAGVRMLLSGAAGSAVHLHIRGPAGHERDAALTLADYV